MSAAKYFGYYLHKDGTPVVVENKGVETINELKKNDYWKYVRYMYDDKDIHKHLTTYNAGYHTNRLNIKPFYT
jgi:hypothetical protein